MNHVCADVTLTLARDESLETESLLWLPARPVELAQMIESCWFVLFCFFVAVVVVVVLIFHPLRANSRFRCM